MPGVPGPPAGVFPMTFAATLTFYVARRFLAGGCIDAGADPARLDVRLHRAAAPRRHPARRHLRHRAPPSPGCACPSSGLQILPFAILLGGILAFWRLTRSSELIVARAAGVSAWGFLSGPVLVALLFGLLGIAAVSPVSSVMLARAERLDASFLRAGGGVSALAGGRLWLRQADHGLEPGGVAVLSGRPARLLASDRGGEFLLTEVTVWRLSAGDRALARIEAPSARLLRGQWLLADAVLFGPDRLPAPPTIIALPTDLTPDRIESSFASPDTLSFWALPGFIAVLEQAGFSALRHRLQFQSMLSTPALAVAMALLAAGFSMRNSRRGGVGKMIGAGVAAGFGLFMLDRITGEFGESGALPVVIAAWVPPSPGCCWRSPC
jgi:lipopolysaccharide export system permease protein